MSEIDADITWPDIKYALMLKAAKKLAAKDKPGDEFVVGAKLVAFLTERKDVVLDWLKAEAYDDLVAERVEAMIEHENEFPPEYFVP